MAQVQAGSVEAFSELYDRYCDRAHRLAWSLCRDDGCAEDTVQEAFGSIWRSRASYRTQKGSVAAWVLSVVRYRAIDAARRNDRHAAHEALDDRLEDRPAPDDVAVEAVTRADAGHIHALLARLPDAQREAIALAFFGELTHTEIATRLGLASGTVKGRMRLGMNKLRKELGSP